jgi:hypothetical protein
LKFGKYWTTVVVSPFFNWSTDLMLNSGFPFSFSRPDNMPGWRLSFESGASEAALLLASVANASRKANGSGPTLGPDMARLYEISRDQYVKKSNQDRAAIINLR